MQAGPDPPGAPQLLEQQFEPCSCAATMQDTFLACRDNYQLLPLSSCLPPDSSLKRWVSLHTLLIYLPSLPVF